MAFVISAVTSALEPIPLILFCSVLRVSLIVPMLFVFSDAALLAVSAKA